MEYLDFEIPAGVTLIQVFIPSHIPGHQHPTNTFRLQFHEDSTVLVRDVFGKATNDLTEKALATIQAKQKTRELAEKQRKESVSPNLTVQAALEAERKQLIETPRFVPMNPGPIDVPEEMVKPSENVTQNVQHHVVTQNGESKVLNKAGTSARVQLSTGRIIQCVRTDQGMKITPETGPEEMTIDEWQAFASVKDQIV